MPTESPSVRWSLKVSAETGIDLRTYFAQQGTKKGDISKFVEQAVRRDILLRTLDEVQAQNASVAAAEIDAAITSALSASRSKQVKRVA